MLIIISGPSCVGKSFSVAYLCEKLGFSTVVPYTTREPRVSETEGVHYHFRSEETIRALSSDFHCGYWAKPIGKHWYGYTKQVDTVAVDSGRWVIQAYSDLALKIKIKNSSTHTIFLDFLTDRVLVERIAERFGANKIELAARMAHAQHERQNKMNFNHYIQSDNHERTALEVATYARSI